MPGTAIMTMPESPANLSQGRARLAFGGCFLLSLLPIWLPKYLPLTDLPQHAAQIAILLRYDDPSYGYREAYELRFFTPYLFGYGLTYLLGLLFSVLTALKVVLSLYILGFALALRYLLGATKLDPWWSLLAFPLAYGYAFYWGFLNFVVALPLGIAYLGFVARRVKEPNARDHRLIFIATTALFFAHLMIFAICGAGAALWSMANASHWRRAVKRAVPFAAAAGLALVWVLAMGLGTKDAPIPPIYGWGLHRIIILPALTVGYAQDPVALVLGLVLVALMLVSRPRLRSWRAAIPLTVVLLAYLSIPQDWLNIAFLYPRLAALVWPCLLLALRPGRSLIRPNLLRGLLLATSVVSMALVLSRFLPFDRDARQIDALFTRMAPRSNILYIPLERGEMHLPGGVPMLHHGVWREVEAGGYSAFSFAHTSHAVVSWRDSHRPTDLQGRDGWVPAFFRNPEVARRYDYFLVRHPQQVGNLLLTRSPVPICYMGNSGYFWLYRRAPDDGQWSATGRGNVIEPCDPLAP